MSDILPQGLSASEFKAALDAFRKIVGARWVIVEPTEGLNSYRDQYSPRPASFFLASAAVAPDSVEQIQQILKVANDYGIPLWTVGAGRNLAYGGAAPRENGYVVLDLKRMNRILEVNEQYGYALLEPGVTYFELYRYLQDRGHKLWIDCAAPGWGSVVGNALEHGVGYTPYGEHFTMSCGMEVVLANGEVVRTGMGALPGNNTWQLFKYGFGPFVDGLFTQSNFGVVTKMGVWLMPEPPGVTPFMITYQNEDDLHAITERLRPLKVNSIIPNGAVTAHAIWEASVQVTRSQYYDGDGPMPESNLRRMIEDLDIGIWNFYGAVYGPPPVMEAGLSVVRDALLSIPGAKMYLEEDRKGDGAFVYRAELMRGVPNMTEFGIVNWTGGGAHLDFSPVLPTTGDDAMKQFHMIRDRAREFGFDYVGEFAVGWREMHHIFMIVYDTMDDDEKSRARELFSVLVREAAAEGYGEYRTHLEFMDDIAATYDWNDGALWDFHETIKDALDPNGILSPGKMGIWPKRMRDAHPRKGASSGDSDA